MINQGQLIVRPFAGNDRQFCRPSFEHFYDTVVDNAANNGCSRAHAEAENTAQDGAEQVGRQQPQAKLVDQVIGYGADPEEP